MCSDGMLEQMDNDQLIALLSSLLTDEEKRNKLIEFTKSNQDNHSAWIIHIKDVITEEGDDKLVNEESTARCNVINIIPQVVVEDGDDAVVEDNNDVVIVKEAPKRQSFYKRIKNLFYFSRTEKK
jgi:hypothetical protein